MQDGSFNNRVEQLIIGIPADVQAEALTLMEQMISHSPVFYDADKKYLPILIYKSEPICYGILNHFADCMANALERLGETVEIFDCTEHPLDDLRIWAQYKYKAVIGFQSYFFSIRLVNGELLHDYFDAPLFNVLLDHPTVMHHHLLNAPHRLTILTHDLNYKNFLETYYADKVSCAMLAPGGESYPPVDKCYDLTFVGSYQNWRCWLPELPERHKHLLRRLICEMKHHPNDTYESCFQRVLHAENIRLTIEEQRTLLHECHASYKVVMSFYRTRIIRIILDAGIELHVFGESWKCPEWENYPNLIIHPELTPNDSLLVYAQSRLSLNIMSWHKGGFTERIANMMLCGTVAVSDCSTYLTSHYTDGADMILFDLKHPEQLPGRIKQLLDNPTLRNTITYHAYEKAQKELTWDKRAEEFLNLL